MMRTTKEQRKRIRSAPNLYGPQATEVFVRLLDDLDTLEAKLAKAREALKDVITLMSGAPTVSPLTDDVVLARARAALGEIGESE